mmetsp:Transcript_10542/g.30872  ORF Transcript_10542/g.30872 Transcript_10542/m.30872 type:complete len:270 (+) Transcript_10542:895-1704(+)
MDPGHVPVRRIPGGGRRRASDEGPRAHQACGAGFLEKPLQQSHCPQRELCRGRKPLLGGTGDWCPRPVHSRIRQGGKQHRRGPDRGFPQAVSPLATPPPLHHRARGGLVRPQHSERGPAEREPGGHSVRRGGTLSKRWCPNPRHFGELGTPPRVRLVRGGRLFGEQDDQAHRDGGLDRDQVQKEQKVEDALFRGHVGGRPELFRTGRASALQARRPDGPPQGRNQAHDSGGEHSIPRGATESGAVAAIRRSGRTDPVEVHPGKLQWRWQ